MEFLAKFLKILKPIFFSRVIRNFGNFWHKLTENVEVNVKKLSKVCYLGQI